MRIYSGLALALLCGACATEKPLYTWGNYESVIYDSYQKSGSPNNAIGKLEKDAANHGKSLKGAPPGYHAHLGFLHYQMGNQPEARKHFEKEKVLFPMSSKLMDRLINPALNRKTKSSKGDKS